MTAVLAANREAALAPRLPSLEGECLSTLCNPASHNLTGAGLEMPESRSAGPAGCDKRSQVRLGEAAGTTPVAQPA